MPLHALHSLHSLHYRWDSHHSPAPHLAACRHQASADQAPRWHDHDYFELFWIEAGSGWHLRPEGEEALAPGDGRCIRPHDLHTFRAAAEGLSWINVAIHAGPMQQLRQRYGGEQGWWPWDGPQPWRFHLGAPQRRQLAAAAEALPTAGQSRIDADWFVLGFLRLLDPPGLATHSPQPDWLARAVRRVAEDEAALQLGIPALVAAAGRSARHCNRALREHYGLTAGELLRQLRLEHAARLLHFTRRPITAVALDAGFEHLGTFYRLFRDRYGTTPRGFRLQGQA